MTGSLRMVMMARILMKMVMIRKVWKLVMLVMFEMNKYEDSPPRQLGYKNTYKQIAVLADDYTDTFIIEYH